MAPYERTPGPVSLHESPPFHPPRAEHERVVAPVTGDIPAWLRGNLLRTCPAIFERGDWRARHLFDGLGMLYGFSVREGQVHYTNRYLRGRQYRRISRTTGEQRWDASWAEGPRRPWFQRLVQPIPTTTDNANVNLCRVGGDYVAMTETAHQLRFDPETLETLGPKRYADSVGDSASMIAHPHYDPATKSVVSIAYSMSRRSELMLYRVGSDGASREVVARKHFDRLPYVHDFGLTPNFALVVLHPYELNPMRMLWSQKGIVDHFHWDPSRSTRIAVIDRRDGSWREVEVPGAPFFMFHAANAFERSDGELVLDVLAYPDDAIVEALRVERLLNGIAENHATMERITIAADPADPADRRSCTRARVTEHPFEFPTIDYRRHSGREYRYCWGTENTGTGPDDWRGRVLKVDTHHGDVRSFDRIGWNVGEPIFVPREPRESNQSSESSEDDGVLLVVASDLWKDRAELLVLDARTMTQLASAAVDDAIPIGFHGQFFSQPSDH